MDEHDLIESRVGMIVTGQHDAVIGVYGDRQIHFDAGDPTFDAHVALVQVNRADAAVGAGVWRRSSNALGVTREKGHGWFHLPRRALGSDRATAVAMACIVPAAQLNRK